MTRLYLKVVSMGLLLGVALGLLGVSDYDEMRRMFTLQDPRLYLTFAVAVSATTFGLWWFSRTGPPLPKRKMHPGVIPGAVLFGIGWAMTGACPASAMVMLGEGKARTVVILGGMLLGSWLYGRVHERYFRWDTGSCGL